ncbi:MAG: tetraacyldisaccharide 4'-kinase [Proteobacteria bacterium]|nr:tetraacyldisaccharide 4'-kinase [Pseudomonadota bacterium]
MKKLILKILSILYGTGVKIRLSLYSSKILKTKTLPCMVISIGNITAGGTGKTPMTMHIAKRLVVEGSKVVILSRGYKGEYKDIGIVSNGAEVLMSAREAGDEPYLMAEKLKAPGNSGVPVVVCADRYKAGLMVIEKFSPDIILLDDGFQHLGVNRDMNLMLIDAKTDLKKEKLLPAGTLREPIEGLKRARVIMIKDKAPRVVDPYIKAIDKPVVGFKYEALKLRALSGGRELELSELKNKKIFIFSALASPGSFERTVEGLGAKIIGKRCFTDHHNFTKGDVEEILSLSKDAEIIVTTEKDAVKLAGFTSELNTVYVLEVEVVIENKENFFRKIR